MNKYQITVLIIIVITVIGINSAKDMQDKYLHVIICDVGQGDGILLVTPLKKYLLIDAGPDNSIQSCLAKFMPFYNHMLEGIIVSHFHADHIDGFIDLMKAYSIKTIIKDELNYPSPDKLELEKLSLEETKNIYQVWKGDEITIEPDLLIKVWWPGKDTWNRTNGNWEAYLADFNDSSLILEVTYKNTSIFLSGDAGTAILDAIADSADFQQSLKNTSIHIYKIPHHGSRDANSEKFINRYKPQIAVISSGSGNKFNHPHVETLTTLAKTNIAVYRTDLQGNIHIQTDGLANAEVKVDHPKP